MIKEFPFQQFMAFLNTADRHDNKVGWHIFSHGSTWLFEQLMRMLSSIVRQKLHLDNIYVISRIVDVIIFTWDLAKPM